MNDLDVGDKFTMYVKDLTMLNRLLYWAIKRPIPMKLAKFTIKEVVGPQVSIKPLFMDRG